MPEASRDGGWRCPWPFALLCLLAASRWIVSDALPESESSLLTQAIACWVGVIGFAVVAVLRRQNRPSLAGCVGGVLAGVGILAAPALGALLHGAAGNAFNRTAALCLVPVILSVLGGISERTESPRLALWPGLAGVAGGLFLFPLALPVHVADWLGLLVPPLAVAFACAYLRPPMAVLGQGLWFMAVFCVGGGIALSGMAWLHVTREHEAVEDPSLIAVGLDLALVILTAWAITRVSAGRYASRYFLVPALTVIEGLVLTRPGFSLRVYVGVALLLVGAMFLWRSRGDEAEPASLHLL